VTRSLAMWFVKDLLDRAQVAFLLWRLHRARRKMIDIEHPFY
jgi:hypothetical protein